MTTDDTAERSTPKVGDSYVHERTFTPAEVRQFADLSADSQPRHTEPDEDGRLLVHGLLTATLLTKIGGDLEMLAYSMDLSFVRPVYTGERVVCTWTNKAVERQEDRYRVTAEVVCHRRGEGEPVLKATVEGFVS